MTSNGSFELIFLTILILFNLMFEKGTNLICLFFCNLWNSYLWHWRRFKSRVETLRIYKFIQQVLYFYNWLNIFTHQYLLT